MKLSSTTVLGKFFVGVSGLVLRDLREKNVSIRMYEKWNLQFSSDSNSTSFKALSRCFWMISEGFEGRICIKCKEIPWFPQCRWYLLSVNVINKIILPIQKRIFGTTQWNVAFLEAYFTGCCKVNYNYIGVTERFLRWMHDKRKKDAVEWCKEKFFFV